MQFNTDKQTLDDLQIFAKPGGKAVYHLFNNTVTRGGALLLEEMFRYPLSNAQAINQRSGIIRYVASARLGFPFASILFDAAEPYLENTDERSRLTREAPGLGRQLGQLIAPDVEYQFICKGVTAVMDIIKGWYALLEAYQGTKEHPYQTEIKAVARLLEEGGFAALRELQTDGKLSHAVIAEHDTLFRFRNRALVKQLLRHTYYLDVYTSVAKVAGGRSFAFANALSSGEHRMALEGLYHPFLEQPVANSLEITPQNNILFLTGANMAGKSTFMKSLGIALFLAHMGFPVPAARMEFSVMDGIYTTINLPDNLSAGASHFYAEVLRIKKIAAALKQGKRLFIVFDELFRGTNVKDAYEATIAITAAFAEKPDSMFVISTHIVEAGEVLREQCRNVYFVYLPTRLNGTVPEYTYRLENGITDDRHGMIIIRNEGILEMLDKGKKA